MDVSLSLIIPAWNEELLLPALLDSVDIARHATDPDAGAIEVIVADNASTDKTAAIAAARGCRVVLVEKRVIGAVRNAGAAAARGGTLAFIDADSRIDPGTFSVIRETLASPMVVAGATFPFTSNSSPFVVRLANTDCFTPSIESCPFT